MSRPMRDCDPSHLGVSGMISRCRLGQQLELLPAKRRTWHSRSVECCLAQAFAFFAGPQDSRSHCAPSERFGTCACTPFVSLPQPDGTAGQCGKGDAAAQDDIEAQAGQPAAADTTSADQTGGDQDRPDDGHDQWRTTGSAGGNRSGDGKFSRDHGILQLDGLLRRST